MTKPVAGFDLQATGTTARSHEPCVVAPAGLSTVVTELAVAGAEKTT
jgi:hypothetical protein